MKSIYNLSLIFIVAFLILPQLHAQTLAQQAAQLADTVKNKTNKLYPDQLDYESFWDKKCGRHSYYMNGKCVLLETDVLGEKGRKNYVYLFRGEGDLYTYPATSSFLRLVQAGKAKHFESEQSVESLARKMKFDLRTILGGQIEKNTPTNMMNLLLTSHISEHDHYSIQLKDDKYVPIDALVSYTYSPFIAGEFASGGRGRIMVISVPLERVQSCAEFDMESKNLVDSAKCDFYMPREEDYSSELEVDYLLMTNPDDITDVYLHTKH